jgi:prenyltransferase beta subunit
MFCSTVAAIAFLVMDNSGYDIYADRNRRRIERFIFKLYLLEH